MHRAINWQGLHNAVNSALQFRLGTNCCKSYFSARVVYVYSYPNPPASPPPTMVCLEASEMFVFPTELQWCLQNLSYFLRKSMTLRFHSLWVPFGASSLCLSNRLWNWKSHEFPIQKFMSFAFDTLILPHGASWSSTSNRLCTWKRKWFPSKNQWLLHLRPFDFHVGSAGCLREIVFEREKAMNFQYAASPEQIVDLLLEIEWFPPFHREWRQARSGNRWFSIVNTVICGLLKLCEIHHTIYGGGGARGKPAGMSS